MFVQFIKRNLTLSKKVLFWVKIFELIMLFKFFFYVIFGWLFLFFSAFPSPSSFPSLTHYFHGDSLGRKSFLLFTRFISPLSNEWYVLIWKLFLLHSKACLFCWINFSSELMSAIDLWRLWNINEIVFLNFLFNVFQVVEPNLESKGYDI